MMKNKLLFGLVVTSLLLFSCKGDDDTGGNGTGGDGDVQISISDITEFEGDEPSSFEFKVSLSRTSETAISVDYKTVDAAATAGEDYVAQNGTVTFSPSETEKSILIEIIPDTIKEANEDFFIELTNASGAVLEKDKAIGTMRNDDTFLPNSEDGYITPTSYAGYTLKWADEFDGTEIDASNWTHESGNNGWGNQELQNYTDRPENSYISDGKLVIEAKKESLGGSDYTSARIISAGKQEFSLGRIDIRAKIPKGQGMWPALWMLGSNFSTAGWPNCGEIDIMENVGFEPSTTHGAAHWGPPGSNSSNTTRKSGDYDFPAGVLASDEFHVFSIIWEFNSIKWYVDDNLFLQLSKNEVGTYYNYNSDFFFILNIAVGGQWPGNPDSTTEFPQRMFVDYIRVFQ